MDVEQLNLAALSVLQTRAAILLGLVALFVDDAQGVLGAVLLEALVRH